jgi:hypothetical protein
VQHRFSPKFLVFYCQVTIWDNDDCAGAVNGVGCGDC